MARDSGDGLMLFESIEPTTLGFWRITIPPAPPKGIRRKVLVEDAELEAWTGPRLANELRAERIRRAWEN